MQALRIVQGKYKRQGLAARDTAFEVEAAEERKLREELGALPKPAEGQIGAGKARSRGKIAAIARKRKALAEGRASGVHHASKRVKAAGEGSKG